MASVVRKNNRSQEDIRNALGLRSANTSRTAQNPTSGNIGVVVPTSGSGAAPNGWYNPVPTASQVQGMPSEAIGFDKPSAAVTQGVTVGQAPGGTSQYSQTTSVSSRYPQRNEFTRRVFTPSTDTDEYYEQMKDVEDDRPAEYQSRYEGAIQSILDGILNRKSFDLKSDANYNMLYDQARDKYMAQGNRAMRDTMGAMQAATGGYGSTAATAAAGQAYDQYMQGLNDQNLALAQMAYQMYGDETADRYNQLGAVEGLENTDYSRYRDTVNDWMNDRAYYANQYQNFFGNDMSQYQFDTGLDWSIYQDNANRDWWEFEYGDQMEYQKARDAKSDYDAAFNKAYQLANAGQGIPAHYADQLEDETVAALNAIAAQVQAEKAAAMAGGSGGGGSRRRRSGGGDEEDYVLIDTGAPYSEGIGLDRNRNAVAATMLLQNDDQSRYETIENAVATGVIQPEQAEELIDSAGIDMSSVGKKKKKGEISYSDVSANTPFRQAFNRRK